MLPERAIVTGVTPLDLLERQAASRPDKIALVYLGDASGEFELELSYAALAAQVDRAARAMAASGIEAGDTVGLLLSATSDAVVSLCAAASIARAHPINLLLSRQAIKAQLAALDISLLITMPSHPLLDLALRLTGLPDELVCLKEIVELTVPDGGAKQGTTPWADFIGRGGSHSPKRLEADEIAAVFSTGGTTAAPKLAQLTSANLAVGARMVVEGFKLLPDDRFLSGLPLFHVGGVIDAMLAAFDVGATLILPTPLGVRDPTTAAAIWHIADRHDATVVGLVPTSLAAAASQSRDGLALRSLRGIVTGSAPLPDATARAIEARVGVGVHQLYGMTEASGVIACDPLDRAFTPGSSGRPCPGCEVRIGDGTLGPNVTGPIFVRGENVFLGYLGDLPTSIDADGWLDTGDLGAIDNEGLLYVQGRTKDLIIRGGHNIDPLLIEDTANCFPDVLHAAAIGCPDAYAGEVPYLFVQARSGASLDRDQLRIFVSNQVADSAARPREVIILDQMPLTPFGKVFKPALRDLLARFALSMQPEKDLNHAP